MPGTAVFTVMDERLHRRLLARWNAQSKRSTAGGLREVPEHISRRRFLQLMGFGVAGALTGAALLGAGRQPTGQASTREPCLPQNTGNTGQGSFSNGGNGVQVAGGIGGGSDYGNLHSTGDFVVSSLSDIQSALSSASSGEVVFIEGSADIQASEGDIFVPSGVTLASDRGVNGSNGARIFSDDRGDLGLIEVAGRLEGIEVAGPLPNFVGYVNGNEVDYPVGDGVHCADGAEIANCDMHHFGRIIHVQRASNVHIHHNTVTWSPVAGLGYGIKADSPSTSDRPIIEYNLMHSSRHDVAAHGNGYIVRHNVFEKNQWTEGASTIDEQVLDDHDSGMYTINNNEFRNVGREHFSYRDGVIDGTEVFNNWFHDTNPEGLDSEFDSSMVFDNHFGTSSPPAGIGPQT